MRKHTSWDPKTPVIKAPAFYGSVDVKLNVYVTVDLNIEGLNTTNNK